MRIYKRKGSPYWWITWNDQNGMRHRRSSGTVDQKQAEALASKWVQEDFMEQHFGKIPEVPFNAALLNYAKAKKEENPDRFFSTGRYCLKRLQARFGNNMLSEISDSDITKFVRERRSEGVKEATIQKDVSTLKAILNLAHREKMLGLVPKFPRMKTSKGRNRFLTEQEEQSLLRKAPLHLKPLIILAVETGGRRSSLMSLDWQNVVLKEGEERLTFRDTKNGEDHTVYLTKRAIAVLTSIGPKKQGRVITYRGKPFKDPKTAFRRACKKAGLVDVQFHDLRHTFTSRLIQGGLPLFEVKEMTGHKTMSQVMRYAHLAPDYQRRGVRVLNQFGHNLGTVDGSLKDDDLLSA